MIKKKRKLTRQAAERFWALKCLNNPDKFGSRAFLLMGKKFYRPRVVNGLSFFVDNSHAKLAGYMRERLQLWGQLNTYTECTLRAC